GLRGRGLSTQGRRGGAMTTRADPAARSATTAERVELAIGGMTCASCAARIERKLNRLDTVTASVNFATGTASVAYDPARLEPGELVTTVEATGYTAALPAAEPGDREAGPDEAATLRRRLVVSAVLATP